MDNIERFSNEAYQIMIIIYIYTYVCIHARIKRPKWWCRSAVDNSYFYAKMGELVSLLVSLFVYMYVCLFLIKLLLYIKENGKNLVQFYRLVEHITSSRLNFSKLMG